MTDPALHASLLRGLGDLFLAPLLAAQVLGLGWPLIARWKGRASERLALGLGAGVFASYLIAFAVCLAGLGPGWHRLAPALAVFVALRHRRAIADFFSAPELRSLLPAWLLFAAWLLGWLALVRTYWGGGWMGDWVEHYQRARFFLDHAPLDTVFHTRCGLTARPPLWNLVLAGWLGTTGGGFSAYQAGMTLGASLLLPAAWAVLAKLGGGARAGWLLTALLMGNASLLQNATFPWTKLPAAALVLASLPFLLQACADGSRRHLVAGFALLAVGVLVHYSVAPYVLVSLAASLWARRGHWRDPALWRSALAAGLTSAAILATWLAWALHAYGAAGVFLANTAVADRSTLDAGGQLARVGGNLFRTLVPHFLRPDDWRNFAQSYAWSALRDRGFLLYQTNLWFAIGSVTAPALLWFWTKPKPRDASTTPALRGFWIVWAAGNVLLGVAAHGGADAWGLVHIGLLPLVVLALIAFAHAWPRLPSGLRRLCALGFTVDFAWGTLLHFALQHRDPLVQFGSSPKLEQTLLAFGPSAFQNAWDKQRFGLTFLGDHLAPLAPVLVAGLALIAWRVAKNLRTAAAAHE